MKKNILIILCFASISCKNSIDISKYFKDKSSSENEKKKNKIGNYEKEDIDPNSLLIKASKENDIKGVKEALDKGADINYKNKKSALAYALGNFNKPIIKLLLKKGANCNDIALHLIDVIKGMKDEMLMKDILVKNGKKLIRNGLNINTKNKNGDTI